MVVDRSAKTYERTKLLSGGTEIKVLMCISCNEEMKPAIWKENKGGILYQIWGLKCPTCSNYKDDHYELLRPAQSLP